jgi:hypothetical protein
VIYFPKGTGFHSELAINRIPVIRYFTRYFTRIFTSKKMRNKKIKKDEYLYSILKIDDEYSVKQYPLAALKLEPRAVSPNQSCVTTLPQ